MNKEEYEIKMAKLREERSMHENEIGRINREIDTLEMDIKLAVKIVGKYIIFDRTDKGGYKYYIHVNSFEKVPKGIWVHGFCFFNHSLGIQMSHTETILWEEFDKVTIINENDFLNQLSNSFNLCKEKFLLYLNDSSLFRKDLHKI